MTSTTAFTVSSTQMVQGLVNAMLAPILQSFFAPVVPTIIIGVVLAMVFIIFIAMTFGRMRRSNGLAPSTNRAIGSFSYLIVHSLVILICFKIWGFNMFEESIFYMLQLIAFMSVRIILLGVGIWVY